jgi:hypothetical protein
VKTLPRDLSDRKISLEKLHTYKKLFGGKFDLKLKKMHFKVQKGLFSIFFLLLLLFPDYLQSFQNSFLIPSISTPT